MPLTDKIISCVECGADFTFTVGEQEFHLSKGFTNDPKRCPTCRRARRDGVTTSRHRVTYSAVCATCGKVAELPFEPRGDRPVYCSDCFRPSNRGSRRW